MEVNDAVRDLEMAKIVGTVQIGRAGFGCNPDFNADTPLRKQITSKISKNLDHTRYVQAVQQGKQGRWTTWNVEKRELSWADLWNVSDARISKLIKSSYDMLGTPANLKSWNLSDTSECALCGAYGNLRHILSGCKVSLTGGRYTWRHNKVLYCIMKTAGKAVDMHNKKHLVNTSTNGINFVRSGDSTKTKTKKSSVRTTVLGGAKDWVVMCDLKTQLVFPALVAITNQRPDMLIISQTSKKIILVELTCPWEENAESAHEAKLTKYEELRCNAEENGWVTRVYAVEVCCRGYVSGTLRSCLFALGCSNTSIRSAIKEFCEIAERCSTHIYLSRDKEWNPL